MASQFIVSCPSDNPSISAHPYPTLALTNQNTAVPGQTSELQYKRPDDLDDSQPLYGIFLSGLFKVIVQLKGNTVRIPSDLRGTVYLLVSKDANGVDGSQTVAGPVMLQFSFSSGGQVESPPQ